MAAMLQTAKLPVAKRNAQRKSAQVHFLELALMIGAAKRTTLPIMRIPDVSMRYLALKNRQTH
jgi:hypothetical protein